MHKHLCQIFRFTYYKKNHTLDRQQDHLNLNMLLTVFIIMSKILRIWTFQAECYL